MRITNSMITANTKANLNINKTNADRLNTMTASGQKIVRPSDDPVVAIRAMRLNTTLTELNQYHDKNIADADAWFTDTETALSQSDDVLSAIREKLNQASSEENVTSNLKDILEELKQLKDQYYALGNTDCAGRTVFTGYRTGEMLTFTEKDTIDYHIYENFGIDDLETIDYISGKQDITQNTPASLVNNYNETDVQNNDVYRIRLSYDNLNGDEAPSISYVAKNTNTDPSAPKYVTQNIAVTTKSITGLTQAQKDDIYTKVPDDGAYYIPETGEVILGKTAYDKLKEASTFKDAPDPRIQIEYDKKNWQKGDLRPEHYFQCNTPKDVDDERTYSTTYPDGIEYNFNREDDDGNPTTSSTGTITGFKEQELTYEIAYNQSIQINTHASDAYSHDIGRDIDELINATQLLVDADAKVSTLTTLKENATNDLDAASYGKMLAAAEKEQTLIKEKVHSMYTSAITSFKGYSDDINKQIANLGALTSRLEMTKSRVKDQENNVKTLADENINADITETALDYKNAELALEAAQLAAGKIANQTLLNYI